MYIYSYISSEHFVRERMYIFNYMYRNIYRNIYLSK